MDPKQKTLGIIFVMVFIATTSIILLFNDSLLNAGTEGKAISQFNSTKEKSNYCTSFCDEKMNEENPEYSEWVTCHQKCINN